MNRYILKHVHSNLYLVVLGIYPQEEATSRSVTMGGVMNVLGYMQFKQLNLPIYLKPDYHELSELRNGKHSVPVESATPAGVIVQISSYLTTAVDFGCSAVVVAGLVRLFEPLQAWVDNDAWGFDIRGMCSVFHSDHAPSSSKTMTTITGWDVFEREHTEHEIALLNRVHTGSIGQAVVQTYTHLSLVERQRSAVVQALQSVESINVIKDVSFMHNNQMQYTFRFQMDLTKVELLYRVFPPYQQLRLVHNVPWGEAAVAQSVMDCYFDVGNEDDLQKLVHVSLSSFFNNPAGTQEHVCSHAF